MTRSHLIAELTARGWLHWTDDVNDRRLRLAVERYQHYHGLRPTGATDRPTERALSRPRICGLPDRMAQEGSLPRWRPEIAAALTWHAPHVLPGMSREDVRDVFAWAWSQITPHAAIAAEYSANPKTAHVIHAAGHIDGQGQTLAWSYVPHEHTTQIDQLYDHQEPWEFADRPGAGKIDLGRVAIHEILHALGVLHHEPRDGQRSLMDPYYDPEIRLPQPWEIRELVCRYGRPAGESPAAGPAQSPGQPLRVAVCVAAGDRYYVGEADGLREVSPHDAPPIVR